MKKFIVIGLLITLLFTIPAFGAGTCTTAVKTSYTAQDRVPDSKTVIVTLACTASATSTVGSYPSTTVSLTPSSAVTSPWNLYGYYLYQVGRTPGLTQPTGNYTITITDTQGFALDLALLTSNGSASAAQLTGIYSAAVAYPVVRSALTVAITGNSVSAAGITLDLVFKAE